MSRYNSGAKTASQAAAARTARQRPMASFREDAEENRKLQTNTAAGSASNAGVFSILTEAQKSDILSRRPGEYSAAAQITVTPQLQANLRSYQAKRATLSKAPLPTPKTEEQARSQPDGGEKPAPTSITNPTQETGKPAAEEQKKPVPNSYKLSKYNQQKYEKLLLRYPNIDIHKDTDYLQIEVYDYVPAGTTAQENVLAKGLDTARNQIRNKKKKAIRTIQLPIPSNISDTTGVSWGEDSINSLAAYALGASADVLQSENFFKGITDMFRQGANDFKALATSGQAEKLAQSFFSSQAANVLGANTTFEGVLARSTGQILNPNKELLFNGVNLRSFNFSIPFAPRDSDESEEVRNIIRTFKESMVPRKSQTDSTKGLFLKTPNVFQLKYMTGAKQHQYLNSFIMAALTNMSVNYTGSGVYMTYGDDKKTPVHMVLNLSFQELNPVYYEDYLTKEGQIGVGY
jgi:hypothetical protein